MREANGWCRTAIEFAAGRSIPLDRLGTTDDRGVAPFCDDVTTTRDTEFAKIEARIKGTGLAATKLGIVRKR